VGRNIAENLARLGVEVCLAGAVGDDPMSEQLLRLTERSGVDVTEVVRVPGHACGMYVAMITSGGEMDTAASDMAVMDTVDSALVDRCRRRIAASSVLVCDANLTQPALQRALEIAADAQVPVILEPVSVAKADRLAGLTGEVFAATPNADEAGVLAGVKSLTVQHTVVTMGSAGASWKEHETGQIVVIPAEQVRTVDVTGAGDAFVAGLAAALRAGLAMREALGFATTVAASVVSRHESAVSREVGERLAAKLMEVGDGRAD
jgi:pseudouridine kinase